MLMQLTLRLDNDLFLKVCVPVVFGNQYSWYARKVKDELRQMLRTWVKENIAKFAQGNEETRIWYDNMKHWLEIPQ